MAPSELVVILETELSRLLDWVRAAESRISFVLPLSTAMLGSLAIVAPPISTWTILAGVTASISILLLIVAISFAALAMFPRTSGPKGSLIYFGGISSYDLAQYSAAVESITTEQYLNDLIKQCHRNAQIAKYKYTWVQRSMGCLVLAALPWVISLMILYSEGT